MSIAMPIGVEVKSEITSNETTSSSSATYWLLTNSANCLAFLTEYLGSFARCFSTEARYFESSQVGEPIQLFIGINGIRASVSSGRVRWSFNVFRSVLTLLFIIMNADRSYSFNMKILCDGLRQCKQCWRGSFIIG